MSREELIEAICPYHDDSCGGDQKCEGCDAELNELLDKYDKEVIKKFAEWLPQHFDLRFSNNPDVWLDEYFNHTRDRVLAKLKKGAENDNSVT